MRVEVTHAGLPEQLQQRLGLAAKLLAGHRIDARVRAWDGTRCHVLVVMQGDAWGARASETAERLGVPTLLVVVSPGVTGSGKWTIAAEQPARALAEMLQAMIVDSPPRVEPRSRVEGRVVEGAVCAAPVGQKESIAGLLQLATDPILAGPVMRARVAGQNVVFSRQNSRVFAADRNELFATSRRLGDAGWQFEIVDTHSALEPGMVSEGLDAYLLRGALRAADRLPRFPDAVVSLEAWPDLGSMPDLLNVLSLVQMLMTTPMDTVVLAKTCKFSTSEVSACLWAFQAAGLLLVHRGKAPVEPHRSMHANRQFSGVLGRIASRFGLSRWLGNDEGEA